MDNAIATDLDAWVAYYAFTGGAAATLLGLLFVAVSLRLDLFRNKATIDVRDFAEITLGGFLSAMIVAGLGLAPHGHRLGVALPVFILGLVGVAVVLNWVREWFAFNPPGSSGPGTSLRQPTGWIIVAAVTAPPVGLVVAAGFVAFANDAGLVLLAVSQGMELVVATVVAWNLLSRARPD